MHDWLVDGLQDDSQVVTASRRLARELTEEHGRRQIADGKLAWTSPSVFAWQDWLTAMLATAANPEDLPTRINIHQSRVLWERCLRREISDPLLNVPLLARQSRESWLRLREFCVSSEECRESARGRDQRLFASAAIGYQSILTREHWVDDASLGDLLLELTQQRRITVPASVTLAGFDRLVPQTTELLDALAAAGTRVRQLTASASDNSRKLYNFDNADAEFRAAGAWARRALEQESGQRIAVVVANLRSDAQRTARLLREGLAPGWQLGADRYKRAVNVSYGRPLSAYPVCTIAILLLRWLCDELSSRDVSLLLRSAWIGSNTVDGRCRLEMHLRRIPDRGWTPEMLAGELEGRDDSSDARDWSARLEVLCEGKRELPRRASPAEWATRFDQTLKAFNWPGDATLGSEEFQIINRWRELLNDLARLELVSPMLTVGEAMGRLATMANEVVFQPEADPALVQLLGPLEAAGMEFDKLWIAGMSSASWPPPGRPLALVSRALQRHHGMPDAEPGDTLDYATRVLHRLQGSAAEVVCSYATMDGESQQTASGLLDSHKLVAVGSPADPGWHAASMVALNTAIVARSDPVPAVAADEDISGGAAAIQRQREEPFSAFVYGRLGVRWLPAMSPGLAANYRGSLIHDALYHLYRGVPDQEALAGWSEAQITGRVDEAIAHAFHADERFADPVLRSLLELEKRRVHHLLCQVIELDCARPPFELHGAEESLHTEIEGIRLRVRVDRVDRDQEGRLVILDYKTGARKKFLGSDGDPRDIQLVVYASAMGCEVSNLGLVNIDSRSVDIDGAGTILTPERDWQSDLAAWQAHVETAARDMHRGDVRLYGQHSLQASRPYALLSRIRELRHDL